MTLQLFAQNIVATGTVRDDNGKPIAGVSVTEKGVTNSTLTDANGNFRLSLTAGRVLVISMAGFAKQEVSVDSKGNIDDDIILYKPIKRVRFGLKGGVDVNYYEYRYQHNPDYQFHNSDIEDKHEETNVGANGGIYMDLNLARVFAFEFGAQVYMRNSDYTTLNLQVAVCKWRMGRRKGLFITWGPGVDLYLKKPANTDYYNPMLSLNWSMGYEFASGIGFRVACKLSGSLESEGSYGKIGTIGVSAGGAFSYRF